MTTYYVTKTGHDTTGNGSEMTPWLTIQKAADIMVAGDTVNVGAGTYVENKWGLNPANSGTLANPITYRANGIVIIDGSLANPTVKFDDNDYIIFDGFEVAYGANNISLANSIGVELKNCIFRDSSESSGISMPGSDSCHVHDCMVSRAKNCGILLDEGAHDNLIEYNTVKDGVSNDGLAQGSTDKPAGDNNVWQYNYSSGNAEDGLDFYSGDRTVIRGNILFDNHEKGINLHGGSHCLVTGNYVSGNGWYGLYMGVQNRDPVDNIIQGNTFTRNGRLLLEAPNVLFKDNTVIGLGGTGREVFQTNDAGTGATITNNVFVHDDEMIDVWPGSETGFSSDYNTFYTTGTNKFRWNGSLITTIDGWQVASGGDSNSTLAGGPTITTRIRIVVRLSTTAARTPITRTSVLRTAVSR